MVSPTKPCPECGATLAADSPGSLCPNCLIQLGFEPETDPAGVPLAEPPTPLPVSETVITSLPALTKVRYFGDYELVSEIAHGGMGVVFKARQVSLKRTVALKMILSGSFASKDFVQRFYTEAEAAARLDHPNIVPIYEIGQHEGQHYFSMKLIEGPSLAETLDRRRRREEADSLKSSIHPPPHVGSYKPREASELMAKVARAVHYAHQRGILHRDLKPGNILLDEAGEPHVTDFGLAKIIESETEVTQTNAVMGSPAYMSPEQASGQTKNLTTAADVYSLGAVFYELLTGRPPFVGERALEIIQQVVGREPVSPRALNSAVDRDLETICLKCLEKDPGQRYGSAEALAEDLERWMRNEPIAARPSTAWERGRKWARRNPKLAGMTAVLIGVIVVAFVDSLWLWRRAERNALNESQQRQRADHERRRAESSEFAARQSLYAAQMSQALDAWDAADLVRAKDLLERQRPRPGQKDLRGFEWRFLWQRCRSPSERSITGSNGWSRISSPDGKTLLVLRLDGNEGARLYDLDSLSETAYIAGSRAQASHNSEFVAVIQTNQTILLWNVKDRRQVAECRRCPISSKPCFLSQNGTHLAFLTTNGTIRIWNLITDAPVAEMPVSSDEIDELTLSHDERRIALNTSENLQIWEIPAGRLLMSLPSTQRIAIQHLALDARGDLVACSLRDNTVGIWEVATGRRVALLRGHSGRVNRIAFSPGGQQLVSISDDTTAKVWDRATWAEIATLRGHRSGLYSCAFSQDGEYLATGGNDYAIKLWRLSEPAEAGTFRGHTSDVWSLGFSPDSKTVYSCSGDGSIRLWSIGDLRDHSVLKGHSMWVRSVALSTKGVLASGSMDGSIRLWDTANGHEFAALRTTSSVMVCNLAFAPDGSTLASSHQDGSVSLWDVGARKEVVLPIRGHGYWVFKVAFSPDGKTLAFGDGETNVVLWDIASQRGATRLGHGSQVVAVAFSPDGKRLASAGRNGTAKLWNVATHALVHSYHPHPRNLIMDLNFSPDGKLLASAGWDRLVKLWDPVRNIERATLKGHRGVVDLAVFSPDGSTLITASADSTIKLWRVDTQLEVGTLRGHTAPATTVACSADGNLLATGGGDKTIRLWQAPSWKEIAEREMREIELAHDERGRDPSR